MQFPLEYVQTNEGDGEEGERECGREEGRRLLNRVITLIGFSLVYLVTTT